jgi:UDP-N-acetyl-D-galactosamine dehydrogenase
MGAYVAGRMVKAMLKQCIQVERARVLVLGLTFKENCPDLRNTRVVDVVDELQDYGAIVDVYDPWADPTEAEREHQIELISNPEKGCYDGILMAVSHDEFVSVGAEAIRAFGKNSHVFYDLKCIFSLGESDLRL